MEKELKEHNDRGYMRLRDVVSSALIEQVLSAMDSVKFADIFKDIIGDPVMDPHRKQGFFPTKAPFKELRSILSAKVETYDMRWVPKNWVVLWSLSDGEEQAPHQDFPKREITHARAGVGFVRNKEIHFQPTIQAGIIFALMDNTKLIVYDGCFNEAIESKKKEIVMQAGECHLQGRLSACGSRVLNRQLSSSCSAHGQERPMG